MRGGIAIVGAEFQEVGTNLNEGAAYLYSLSGSTWSLQQEILAPDGKFGSLFGSSVAFDGNTVVIGAEGGVAQAAYVYSLSGTNLNFQQELTPNDGSGGEAFGNTVAVQGNTIIVGDGAHSAGSISGVGAAYVFTYSGTAWSQQTELTPSDGVSGDFFTSSVAIDGNNVVVGASQLTGALNIGPGAAYVFTGSGSSWTQTQKLTAADGGINEGYGSSIAMSDGTLVVGNPGWTAAGNPRSTGSIYIYTLSGSTWRLQQEITGAGLGPLPNNVSVEGNTVVVDGAPGQGAAFIYTRLNSTWGLQGEIFANDETPTQGLGGAIGFSDGNVAVCEGVGTAVYFEGITASATITVNVVSQDITASNDYYIVAANTPTNLDVLANDTNPQGMGLQVISATAISPTGPTLTQNADGTFTFASSNGGTYTFNYTASGAQQELKANDGAAGDVFGRGVAISGNVAVIGAPNHTVGTKSDAGAAYVFSLVGSTWTFQQELTASDAAPNDSFGGSVAINGNTIVVGVPAYANGPGSAYVYNFNGTTWTQLQELTAADEAVDDTFGASVAVSGDTIFIGATGHQEGSNLSQGAVYVYTLSGSTWSLQQELTNPDGKGGDDFGFSMGVTGSTLAVGAPVWRHQPTGYGLCVHRHRLQVEPTARNLRL